MLFFAVDVDAKRRCRKLRMPHNSGAPTLDLRAERFGVGAEISVPRPKNAIPSPKFSATSTLRNQRSRGGTLMGRGEMVTGPKLTARNLATQRTEAKIGANILNKRAVLSAPSSRPSLDQDYG